MKQISEGFEIIKVQVDDFQTCFTIDGFKEGCNEIVFEFNERRPLRELMTSLFRSDETGPRFDFEIDKEQPLAKPRCKIKAIVRYESG
jgi:hypothetical protein